MGSDNRDSSTGQPFVGSIRRQAAAERIYPSTSLPAFPPTGGKRRRSLSSKVIHRNCRSRFQEGGEPLTKTRYLVALCLPDGGQAQWPEPHDQPASPGSEGSVPWLSGGAKGRREKATGRI